MRFAFSPLVFTLLLGCGHGDPGGITAASTASLFATDVAAQQREQEWAQREALIIQNRELNSDHGDELVKTYAQFSEFNDDIDLRGRGRGKLSGGSCRFDSAQSFAGVELNRAHAWQPSVAETEPTNQIVVSIGR